MVAAAFLVGALLTIGIARTACADEPPAIVEDEPLALVAPPLGQAIHLAAGAPTPFAGVLLPVETYALYLDHDLRFQVAAELERRAQEECQRTIQQALSVQGSGGSSPGWWAGVVTGFLAGGTAVAIVLYYAIQAVGAFAP